jgi:hypothetical protein
MASPYARDVNARFQRCEQLKKRGDGAGELLTLWQEAVARSRSAVVEALAAGGLDRLATGFTNSLGEAPSLRRLMIDMIEEYSRHVGHADLIRKSVDGLVGEDPPR